MNCKWSWRKGKKRETLQMNLLFHYPACLKVTAAEIPMGPWALNWSYLRHPSHREETQAGSIHISRDPPQHVVMLANQIWRQQVKARPLWAVCFHKWICLIWEINRLLSNLFCDWSCDPVTRQHDGCQGSGREGPVNPFLTHVPAFFASY